MHEFEFIDWVKRLLDRPANRKDIPVGIGDDMAVINFQGGKLLLGSDMTVEDVHFDFVHARPERVGHKALGRCLSDCAAMAGLPIAAIISLAKPTSVSQDVLKDIYRGLAQLADRFACPIVGGDTSSSPGRLIIDVCLLGKCEQNEPVLRSGAMVGDYLYVTSLLGGSILGKHLEFEPRIGQARWCAQNLPLHAMIDISDGLSSDLGHLCRQSHCGAELAVADLEKIISPDARKLACKTGQTPLDHALNDGEDFELLAAIAQAPDNLPRLPETMRLFPVGRIIHGNDIYLMHSDGRQEKLFPGGFVHF
ncbi:MAG: thiamine-phosphate kinase [Phycisphaerae bacterium]